MSSSVKVSRGSMSSGTSDTSNSNVASIVNTANSSASKLTDDEVSHLFAVMQRAKKFDEEERAMQNKIIEGQLYKWTNVVKGWQYRWFVINPARGTLEYYIIEERKKNSRGCIYLAGCQIIPSEEDSQTFAVNAATGDTVFKLKATDAKERQFWVNNLRLVAQNHSDIAENSHKMVSINDQPIPIQMFSSSNETTAQTMEQSLDTVQSQLIAAQKKQISLEDSIEELTVTDADLLLIKATSQAAIFALEQSFNILQELSKS